MKVLEHLILFIIITSSFGVDAQLAEIPSEGSTYTYSRLRLNWEFEIYADMRMATWGDSVLLDEVWWRPFITNDDGYYDTLYYRSEADKWFVKNYFTSFLPDFDEFLAYDWSVEAGDTIYVYGLEDALEETLIDSITFTTTIDGVERKLFHLSTPDFGWNEPITWLEGIGAIDHYMDRTIGVEFVGVGVDGKMVCFEENGNLIFENDNENLPWYLMHDYENCSWNPIGIYEIESPSSKLKLFPNPATSKVILSPYASSNFKLSEILVFDLRGTAVRRISGATEKSIEFDVSNLSPGVYFVQVMDQNQSIQNLQLIVE